MGTEEMNEYLGNMQKSQTGILLALGAVSDSLSKMNVHLDKQAAKEEEMKMAKEAEMAKTETNLAKQNLIKEITTGVISSLQKENMELNASKFHPVKHKDIFNAEGGDEDKQVDAKPRPDTKEVQKPIQAMLKELIALNKHFLKQHADLYEDEEAKEDVLHGEEEKPVEMAAVGMGEEDEEMVAEEADGAAEYPMEEDEFKDKDMYKQFKALKKEMSSLKKSFDTEVEKKATKMADETLAKQGWTKEISRQPKLIKDKTMGLNEVPITKSKNKYEVAEELSQLSWKQITDMRAQALSGDTEGLPSEVVGS